MTRPAEGRSALGSTCYRHKNRTTNVQCQNCGKPICTECMRESPVGLRCPECAPTSRQVFNDDLIATKVLIGICVAIYLVQVGLQISNSGGGNSIMSTTDNDLFEKGALYAVGVSQNHEWYRIITSGFLHAGLFHVALNSFFIYSLGQLIEPALGKLRFTLVYFVTLLGGAVGALALSGALSATIGASGAGFGLLGAALVMARLRRNEALASQLMVLALINFAFTFAVAGISVGGHLGGFLIGGVCGWIVYGPFQRQRGVATGLLVGLGIICFIAALVVADAKTTALISSGLGG
jgi:membrane associated rhomboid family serine protease